MWGKISPLSDWINTPNETITNLFCVCEIRSLFDDNNSHTTHTHTKAEILNINPQTNNQLQLPRCKYEDQPQDKIRQKTKI